MKSLLLLISAVVCCGAGVNLPTSQTSLSPDSRWFVRCETTKQSDGFLHTVYLGRSGEKKEEAIWQATRSCDVLWSADGRCLAITDWTGSNLSEIQIVDVGTAKAHRLEVAGVEKLIQKEEMEGHFYYEALRWETSRRLQIRVFGHTDENPSHGFAYYLSVDIKSGDTKLLKKEDQEPNQTAQTTLGSSAPLRV
jgi:hypothetical protein